MSIDLERDLRTYVKYLDAVNTQEAEGDVLTVAGPRVASPSGWKPRAWAVAVAAVAVLAVGSITLLTGQTPPEVPLLSVDPPAVDESGALPTRSTPLPDFEGAVPGDDGSGPLSLGVVNDLPNEDRLDFLFEFCGWYGPDCFRDAHFMDPDNPQLGSGVWTADRPFHVRHGFINNGEESLGEGFDVVVYVTSLDGTPSEFGGVPAGATVRYTSDYVLRGTSGQCGPTYRSQTESETCEWFVHDFSDGLPEGRHAIWAVWEAPCSAWLDMGLTESCDNPNEVTSMFSSGYDGPFGPFEPSFTEANEAPQLYR